MAIYDAISEHIQEHRETVRDEFLSRAKWAGGVVVTGLLTFVFGLPIVLTGILITVGVGIIAWAIYDARTSEPNVEVKTVSKGYWTGHSVSRPSGSYLFDATRSSAPTTFKLEQITDQSAAVEIRDNLAESQDLPVVQTEQNDPEAVLKESVSQIDDLVQSTETHELKMPIIDRRETVESLRKVSADATDGTVTTADTEIDAAEAESRVGELDQFEEMVDEDHGDAVLQEISELSASLADDLTGLQETAVSLLNDHIQTAGDLFGMKTYNFYCPTCDKDDIKSTLTPLNGEYSWHCATCRSKFDATDSIPRHKIRDDVVVDIIDDLWVEKDDEKRRIYERIEDQKEDLQEREFEQKQQTIRNVTDRIKDLREEIQDLRTEAEAKEGAVEKLGSLMIEYERLQKERVERFQNDVSEAFDEIDEETDELIEETQNAEQQRLEEAEEEAKQKAEIMREEERALEREKMAMQQEIAEKQVQAQADIAKKQTQAQKSIAKQQAHANKQTAKKQLQGRAKLEKASTMTTLKALKNGKGGR